VGLYLHSAIRLHGVVLSLSTGINSIRNWIFPNVLCNTINLRNRKYRKYNPVEEYEGITRSFPDWPPGARTANGTALCH
jgi:hypothetical protein